jgi:hypothetical protein
MLALKIPIHDHHNAARSALDDRRSPAWFAIAGRAFPA